MTRDQLRSLENELVICTARRGGDRRQTAAGTLEVWRHVEVRRWDGDAQITSWDWDVLGPAVRLDHVWQPALDFRSRIPIHERGWNICRVGWYARANGSVDLGLQIQPSLEIEEAIELRCGDLTAQAKTPTPQLAASLEQALTALECYRAAGVWLTTSEPDGTAKTLKAWWRLLNTLQRSAEAEARARLGHQTARLRRHQPAARPFVVGAMPQPLAQGAI